MATVLRPREKPHGTASSAPSAVRSLRRNFPFSAATVINCPSPPGSRQRMTPRISRPPMVRMIDWMKSVQITASMPPATV